MLINSYRLIRSSFLWLFKGPALPPTRPPTVARDSVRTVQKVVGGAPVALRTDHCAEIVVFRISRSEGPV